MKNHAILHRHFFIEKILRFYIKNIGHITVQKHVNDVSNFFIIDFQRYDIYKDFMKLCKSQKVSRRKDYLLASSIATATATCHKNNLRMFHRGGVTKFYGKGWITVVRK